MSSDNGSLSSFRLWLRRQLAEFADKAFQYLLWAGGLAAVSFAGAIASALAHAYHNRWIVVGGLSAVSILSMGTVVLSLYRKWRVEARRASETAWRDLATERDALEEELAVVRERFDRETSGSEEARASIATMLNELHFEVVAGKVNIDELVPESILQPTRDVLLRGRKNVRICMLEPRKDEPELWRMRWEAGHLRSVRGNFNRRIDETVAGIAFRNGRPFLSPNVHEDERVQLGRSERRYKSQFVVPIRVGRHRAGVLSVVSHEEATFSETDVTFGEVIAAVIGVALAVEQLRDGR